MHYRHKVSGVIVNTAGAAEFVIYREEKIGLTFTNIFIHTRILLKYIYRGQSSVLIHGYCEKRRKQAALGGTLRNCAFVTAQAKAILEFHLLHTQWSPACPSSWRQLFGWLKIKGHLVPAGSGQACRRLIGVLLLRVCFGWGQHPFSGFPK